MLGILFLNWAVILIAWLLAARVPSPPVYVLAFLIIGIQQHALGLWMHESAHWLLTRNKRVNDVLATILLCGPLFVPLRAYRARHFAHHGFLGTVKDTKRVIFTRIDGTRFWRFLLLNLTGIQPLAIAKGYASKEDAMNQRITLRALAGDALAILLIQAVILFVISRFAPWTFYVWFWVLPWLTLNRLLAGLRAVIEHQPLAGQQHPFVRTLRPRVWERLVFCRAGFDFHWTHHRYPNISCFQLKNVPIDREQPMEERKGYLTILFALIREPSNASPVSNEPTAPPLAS